MSVQTTVTQNDAAVAETPKTNDKELNFRALEAKFDKIITQERAEKERLAKELEDVRKSKYQQDDDEDADPYVDRKRLDKKFAKFGESTKTEIQQAMEEAKRKAKEELKREIWLENNPDFYDVMEKHGERFYQKAPHLADTILKMPDNFERKQLVYHNIKSLGLDRPEQKQPSIQDKVDANRRSPYYQAPMMGTPPYASAGDFSEAGKKNAWEQVQKLKAGLRLG